MLRILENKSAPLDKLVRISGRPISEISARLTIMEVKGMVKNLGKRVYKKI